MSFKIGLVLLVINIPFGYGGLAAAAAVATATHQPRWLILGGACYAVSWLMLGAGFYLCGPEGMRYVRSLRDRVLRRRPSPATPDSLPRGADEAGGQRE